MSELVAPEQPNVPYQSLYRRFRPQRFDEVLGQQHVSLALRNAVRDGRVGHAYLFSGPRGTGKTSTARILAKALNCANPEGGEPCGVCPSCVEITKGSSLDVHELDAATNSGVDAMRDLVSHAALGTPGRWKIYIIDEVHGLTTAASNSLLKTLEEPPGHVVFVLATTDPQKVLPTIRSRTQHFEFHLLSSEILSSLLKQVSVGAGLGLPDEALDAAVRKGRGSARDALSILDQVAAGGIVDDSNEYVAGLAEAIAEQDASAALIAVAAAVDSGRDPLRLASDLADYLRQGFLFSVAPSLVLAAGTDLVQIESLAKRLGLAGLVRSMESIGRLQTTMRDATNPRVLLEVALVRLTHPQVDEDTSALLDRVARLERQLAQIGSGGGATAAAAGAPAVATPEIRVTPPVPQPEASPSSPAAATPGETLSKPTVGALRRQRAASTAPVSLPPATVAPASAAPASAEPEQVGASPQAAANGDAGPAGSPGAVPVEVAEAVIESSASDAAPSAVEAEEASAESKSGFPTRDELVEAWGDHLLAKLPPRARARFRVGRFLSASDGVAVFALPNQVHRTYCEEVRIEVEAEMSRFFASSVALQLVIDPDAAGAADAAEPPLQEPEDGPSAQAAEESMAPHRQPPARPPVSEAPPVPERPSRPPVAAAQQQKADAPQNENEEPDFMDPKVLAAETDEAGVGLSPTERLKQAFPGAEEI